MYRNHSHLSTTGKCILNQCISTRSHLNAVPKIVMKLSVKRAISKHILKEIMRTRSVFPVMNVIEVFMTKEISSGTRSLNMEMKKNSNV